MTKLIYILQRVNYKLIKNKPIKISTYVKSIGNQYN